MMSQRAQEERGKLWRCGVRPANDGKQKAARPATARVRCSDACVEGWRVSNVARRWLGKRRCTVYSGSTEIRSRHVMRVEVNSLLCYLSFFCDSARDYRNNHICLQTTESLC